MKKVLNILILLLCLLFVGGCYKDYDNPQELTSITASTDIKINTSLHGVVTDVNGLTLENFDISINDHNTYFNRDKYYLEVEKANKKNQFISITKDGKEIAFANVSLIENDNNTVNFTAFPEWQKNNDSEKILINDHIELQIQQNENLEMEYGSIENSTTLKQLGKWGIDQNNNDYFLDTQSAFYFNSELFSENGKVHFNLLETSNLSIDNLAIFHFNSNIQQWLLLEQHLQTNSLIDLPTSGYYLLANITEATFIEGQVSYNQLPLAYQSLELSQLHGTKTNILASANGRWSSFVPKNIIAKLSITDPCDKVIVEQELVIDESNVFETILTEDQEENIVRLNFMNVDCNGSILNTSASIIEFGSEDRLMLFSKATADIAVILCGEFSIAGFDVNNNTYGTPVPWNNDIDDELEYLSVCNEYSEGFSFIKINNDKRFYPPFKLIKEDNRSIFKSDDNRIRLSVKGESIGSYAENQVNIYINDIDFGNDGYAMNCETSPQGCGIDDCYISHFEHMSNGLTRISFSGLLWMNTINNPVAGYYPFEGQIVTSL